MVVEKFVPSVEVRFPRVSKGGNLGRPGNLGTMSLTPKIVRQVCAKTSRCSFCVPQVRWETSSLCSDNSEIAWFDLKGKVAIFVNLAILAGCCGSSTLQNIAQI